MSSQGSLNVWYEDYLVGVLYQNTDGTLSFIYTDEWLRESVAFPVSRVMPLGQSQYAGPAVASFFGGLIPEAHRRKLISEQHGISEDNDFSFLQLAGAECAGALSLLPEGKQGKAVGEPIAKELTEEEVTQLVLKLPEKPFLDDPDARMSLAGAQDKLALIYWNHHWGMPKDGTPTTHIIKPEPERFPGAVLNEYACMTLAKELGLKVSSVEMASFASKACLIVERYDREFEDGQLSRLHQEDFCQALGVVSSMKYEEEGGPGIRDCFELIRAWAKPPALYLEPFIDALIFNVLIGNCDAHSKNFSFLYKDGGIKLAPLYDLLSTRIYDNTNKNLAMAIGNARSINDVQRHNWKAMSKECGLSFALLEQRIDKMLQELPEKLTALTASLPDDEHKTLDRIVAGVHIRCKQHSF